MFYFLFFFPPWPTRVIGAWQAILKKRTKENIENSSKKFAKIVYVISDFQPKLIGRTTLTNHQKNYDQIGQFQRFRIESIQIDLGLF